ncbi:hypothetical protein N0V90_010622 [Kalmusia sp. IMI 367209]|nr:hypothetical protein N0V90_010622 [Kalmusia sp. IMI 367209]
MSMIPVSIRVDVDDSSKRAKIADAATEASQPNSAFFTKLNYDVRWAIYDHLYEWLPPLAYQRHGNGFAVEDCHGLVLSCKQANKEMSEAAARHLKIYLDVFMDDFKTNLEIDDNEVILFPGTMPLYNGWGALRSITLSIDLVFEYYLDGGGGQEEEYEEAEEDEEVGEEEDELVSKLKLVFYAFFLRPFDKVTVLFTDSEPDIKNHKVNAIRGIKEKMYDIIENIGQMWKNFLAADDIHQYCQDHNRLRLDCEDPGDQNEGKCNGVGPKCIWDESVDGREIKHTCKFMEDEDTSKLEMKTRNYNSEEEYRFARLQQQRFFNHYKPGYFDDKRYTETTRLSHTQRRPQTKQMVFAWDFRDTTEPFRGKLKGRKKRYTQERVRWFATQDLLQPPQNYEEYDKEWPHLYDVCSHDSMVGEIGIVHPKRWMLSSTEGTFEQLDPMLCWFPRGEVQDVESEGIGMPITEASR